MTDNLGSRLGEVERRQAVGRARANMSQLAAQMHTLALNERMSSPHDAGSSEGRASAAATPVFEEDLAAKTPSILRRIKSEPHLGEQLMIDLEALATDADEPEGGEVEDEDEDERWAHCSRSSELPSLAREEFAQARDDAEAKWRSIELTRSEALATATQPRGEDDMAIFRYSRTSRSLTCPSPSWSVCWGGERMCIRGRNPCCCEMYRNS